MAGEKVYPRTDYERQISLRLWYFNIISFLSCEAQKEKGLLAAGRRILFGVVLALVSPLKRQDYG